MDSLRAIGFDAGYYMIKAASRTKTAKFRTVIARYRASLTNLGSKNILAFDDPPFAFGDEAINYQRDPSKRTDREWIKSEHYPYFFRVAMAELGVMNGERLNVVSGLPIRYYKQDSAALKDVLMGKHTYKRIQGQPFTFTVEYSTVYPQSIGALAMLCMQHGRLVNKDVAGSHVGILDVGGRTTNFLHAYRLRDIPDESDSEDKGHAMWDIAEALQSRLHDEIPGITLSVFQASKIVETGEFKVEGEPVDVSEYLQEARESVVQNIIDKANDLWKNMKHLDYVFVSGGGGSRLFPDIQAAIPRAVLVEAPVNNGFDHDAAIFANAKGYRELAEYQQMQAEEKAHG